jgi:sensor c-di-GMP phosphodiesterase-like protein
VQTILVIARNLGLECVAEGIESEAQFTCLREHGCSLGQGYHFSRPLREAEFLDWMAEQAGAERDRSALLRPL